MEEMNVINDTNRDLQRTLIGQLYCSTSMWVIKTNNPLFIYVKPATLGSSYVRKHTHGSNIRTKIAEAFSFFNCF